ncbi:hypothetical protein ACFQY7_06725 [Actinomadura luteofluorescens]|uniref:hypothetical protein n=1 Tax=Actinomadura luteofluorescens TaxID=46163 RepID=UPI0036378972
MDDLPELGCYGLAGHSGTPRDLLGEVAEAEAMGLGSVFLSERFNTKDAAVLAGAAAAAAPGSASPPRPPTTTPATPWSPRRSPRRCTG